MEIKTHSSIILMLYLLKLFLPVFFVAMFFFTLILQLGDLFFNLVRFMENDIPLIKMVDVMILFLPKCISYSTPLSILFAGGYTIGNLYANNELTAIFASGVSLYMFVMPMVIFSLLLSFGMFFFEDKVVIHTFSEKNRMLANLTNIQKDLSVENVAVMSDLGKIVYYARRYNDIDRELIDLQIIQRKDNGQIKSIIFADKAKWSEGNSKWVLFDSYEYEIEENQVIYKDNVEYDIFKEPLVSFQRDVTNIDEMVAAEAKNFIARIKKVGQPYHQHLVKYYQRFSYSFTIFIVLLMSVCFGGYFKVNVLIMSLMVSLSFAVVYYVIQMMAVVFASWGIVSPIVGAWFPFFFFLIVSLYLLRKART